MVVRVCVPRPIDLERTGRLAAVCVAQVCGDAAVLALEFFDRVERRAPVEERNLRVQASAGDEQQRETGTSLFVIDARFAFFV
jgi:hypothetical protein